MRKRCWTFSMACVLAAALLTPLPSLAQARSAPRSATLATDVNGFRLGMSVAQARSIAPMTFIGGDQFEARTEGFTYNFGVTPKGRIYRVQSTQQLNGFVVDRQFVATLGQRLAGKYGKPAWQAGDVFHWAITEPVTDKFGETLPYTTMWMNAYIGGFGGDPTLEMTMIDFRILWSDQAAENSPLRRRAEGRIQF